MPIQSVSTSVPDAVIAFLESTISPRGRSHWCWKYAGAPASAPSAFYWEDESGRVLGFIGLMRTTLHTSAGTYAAAWFVDWHVAAGVAGGIGLGLLRKAEAAAGILLTLQGTAHTRSILPRLGWHESHRPSTWVRPLSGRFVTQYLSRQGPPGLGRLAALFDSATSRLLGMPAGQPPAGYALADVDHFNGEQDDIWRRRHAEFAPIMSRDGAYLDHFCTDYPDGGYRLRIARRNEGSAGHLVWRLDDDRHGLRRGRIVDLLWPRGEPGVGEWLVRAACCQMQKGGADYVECVASVADLTGILRRLQFRSRHMVPLWYHTVPAEAPPDTWYVSFLDCDRAYR